MLTRFVLTLPIALCACAADKPAAPAQASGATITLTVTQAELGQIAGALVEHPYKDVAPLIDKLQKQFNEQMPKPASGK